MKMFPILIVDDRPENLLTLEALLQHPEREIVKASSGQEALAKTLDHEFALVLMDVQMPDMDGYETAELMRSSAHTRNIPIIFVTAARQEQDRVFKGYESGAVDYLFKPLEPAVLKSKVGVFLELYRQRLELERKTRELDAKVVELEELQQQLEESNERLRLISSLDSLTGLPNRRSFDEAIAREWQRGKRNKACVALIILDIDHFKPFNDTYGHVAGDHCLRRVAQELATCLPRTVDIVARYGGEEFAAILPDTCAEGAAVVAERMRQAVENAEIEHSASDNNKVVTISLGICTMLPSAGSSESDLIRAADIALYRAKKSGRNCYKVAEDSELLCALPHCQSDL